MNYFKRIVLPFSVFFFGLFSFLNVAHAGPKIEHWELENGAQVYWVQSQALPILDVQIAFDAGNSRDPQNKASLSAQVAMMNDKGIMVGSDALKEPAMDENQITDAWLDLGALFDVSSGRDEFGYSLRTLTYPDVMPQAIALASRVMSSPSFPAHVLERDQERVVAALKESLTQPATVASREFYERVYGGHPYGAQSTEESIHAVTIADLKDFHARYILPCRARVAIVGDVTREQANKIAIQLLERLPQSKTCPALPDVAEVLPLTQAQYANMPFQAAQAQIYIGQPGIKRTDPDFITLVVANHILGGNGFSSKLMQEVREKRGLTYGIYSSFSPGAKTGAFAINVKTKPEQAGEALKVTMDVLKDFVQNGPTQEELMAAKANLLGGFPLMFDSNKKLLSQVMNIARNDLPLD
ncbi:MAG: M16 family metallopeptidase, partial [Saezia sp.]